MHHARRTLVLAACVAASGLASAQLFQNLDWKESTVPPAPSFDQSRLVDITMPRYMTLRFGVDPATIAITGDGVVRYVVVASNAAGGATNAFYEGVRCATNEMRGYARYNDGAWHATVPETEWKPMRGMNSGYTWALAQQSLCRSGAPRGSVGEMIRLLKNPVQELG